MRLLHLFTFVFFLLMLAACDKEDNNGETISGKWEAKSFVRTCQDTTENSTLNFTNGCNIEFMDNANVGAGCVYLLFSENSFSTTIETKSLDGEVIKSDITEGTYEIEDNKIKLSYPEGFILEGTFNNDRNEIIIDVPHPTCTALNTYQKS